MLKARKKYKTDLTHVIQSLIQKQALKTQTEITSVLRKQGFDVNQVMVSRILHKIGAVKMNEGDKIVYRLPSETISVSTNASLSQLILNISHNESIIVIKTAPGSAQLVARLLDQRNTLGILGTVAGDDNIFVVPEKTKQIAQTFQNIRELLLG